MQPTTKILHLQVDCVEALPSVTPLFQCSAFSAGSPHFYSRKSNPNVVEFEQVVAVLEDSKYALAMATGMSAIFLVLDLLKPNSKIVINKYMYGCSYKLFHRVSKKNSHSLYILDMSDPDDIAEIPADVDMIFFETPTNPFLKTVNIRLVARAAKEKNPNAMVVVDNTWATPLFQKPLELGADISLYSCTKYFSGHSDVMGGIILLNNNELYEELLQCRFYSGMIMTPYAAWLLRRSMQTFTLRMQRHTETTLQLLDYIKTLPQVKNVFYPSIDGIQLTGYAGIIFFHLKEHLIEKYKELTLNLKFFKTGTGMACVTSMIAQPYTGSHASMSEAEKSAMKLDKSLVRLCFGMEEMDDLKEDLTQALQKIDETHNSKGELKNEQATI